MMFPLETFNTLETPFYAYDIELLRSTLSAIKKCLAGKPDYHVHYALKANNNATIVNEIARTGFFGADCVSGGEIEWAIEHGFKPSSIVYAGVGKTDREINLALDAGIGCFNVESLAELENIDRIAAIKKTKAPVALRINPDIDAHTHPNITTGTYEDQFGIPLIHMDLALRTIQSLNNIDFIGLHFHIGSQITDMIYFKQLSLKVNELQEYLRTLGITVKWINVGGGLGIDYENPCRNPIADFESYFKAFDALNLYPGQQLHFELGRAIVAQCGSLITRVLYIKEGVGKHFAIVDAGFNDLIRPALYGVTHKIELIDGKGGQEENYDIVGPICESTDCFGKSVSLPHLERGDMLAICSAGAYGESMASTYNMRALPKSIFF